MALLGMQPGPSMVTTDLNLTYTIAWTLALASIIGALICFFLASPISKLTFVPFNLIAPFMLMIICFAAFQARRDLNDLLLLFVVGILGIYMRRFGWPRPAFLVGFVLSGQVENYLYQALQFYGWGFVQRPGVLIIGALAVISLLLAVRTRVSEDGAVSNGKSASANDPAAAKPTGPLGGLTVRERWPQLVFSLIILAVFTYALIDTMKLSFLGAVFPLSTSVIMVVFSLWLVWTLWSGKPGHSSHYDQEVAAYASGSADGSTLWPSLRWFIFLFGMTALIGFILSVTIFIMSFLLARTQLGWLKSLFYTACCIGFMVFLGHFLVLDFPAGVLQHYVAMPWPLK
jgi:hypothetical protein